MQSLVTFAANKKALSPPIYKCGGAKNVSTSKFIIGKNKMLTSKVGTDTARELFIILRSTYTIEHTFDAINLLQVGYQNYAINKLQTSTIKHDTPNNYTNRYTIIPPTIIINTPNYVFKVEILNSVWSKSDVFLTMCCGRFNVELAHTTFLEIIKFFAAYVRKLYEGNLYNII